MSLEDVTSRHVCAEQPVGFRLVRTLGEGAVRAVLEPRRGVRSLRQHDRVVEPERQASMKTAKDRELERVRREPAARHLLSDAAVTPEGAYLIGGYGRRARDIARQGRILVLRQEGRAEVDCIDVDVIDQVVRVLTGVLDVERRRPRKHDLHSAVPLPRRGEPARVLIHRQRRRRFRRQAAGERLQLRVAQREIAKRRRILDLRVDRVAGGTIEK